VDVVEKDFSREDYELRRFFSQIDDFEADEGSLHETDEIELTMVLPCHLVDSSRKRFHCCFMLPSAPEGC
jgi:hypothetical protein